MSEQPFGDCHCLCTDVKGEVFGSFPNSTERTEAILAPAIFASRPKDHTAICEDSVYHITPYEIKVMRILLFKAGTFSRNPLCSIAEIIIIF